MVTAAGALGMPPEQKDSMGNWKDQAGAGRREPMHMQYSSEKLKTRAETKLVVLASLHHLSTHVASPSFDRLRAVRQHLPKLTSIVQSTSQWGAGCEELPAPVDLASSDDSDVSSGSQSSSEEAEEEDHEVADVEHLAWVLPSKGLIHVASNMSSLMGIGAKREFKQSVSQGVGINQVASTG